MNTLTKTPKLNLNEEEMRQFLSACQNRGTAIRTAIRILKEQPDKVKVMKHQLSMLRSMRRKVLAAAKKTVDIV